MPFPCCNLGTGTVDAACNSNGGDSVEAAAATGSGSAAMAAKALALALAGGEPTTKEVEGDVLKVTVQGKDGLVAAAAAAAASRDS